MARPTPLDAAHEAMTADPDGPGARLRFHERVLDAELFVPLEAEAEGETLRPRIFALEDGPVALAFDRDDRLAAFLDAPAPYAALAGRRLVALLAGRGIGLVLNPEVAPSQTLLAAGTIDWLAAGGAELEVASARASAVSPPLGVTPALLTALDAKLSSMAGAVTAAWLATLRYSDGGARLALAIEGAPAAAEAAIAEAIAEAVRFSGDEEATLDVTFLSPGAPARAAFERVGLRIDLPAPAFAEAPPGAAGNDPDRPPILR